MLDKLEVYAKRLIQLFDVEFRCRYDPFAISVQNGKIVESVKAEATPKPAEVCRIDHLIVEYILYEFASCNRGFQ